MSEAEVGKTVTNEASKLGETKADEVLRDGLTTYANKIFTDRSEI